MDLKATWASVAEPWVAFARSEAADPAFWAFNLPEFRKLLPPPGRLTLDIGCGEGRVGRALLSLGHHVIGLDSAEALVGSARSHPIPLDVVAGDAGALPLADAVADLVVMFMVVHDVDELGAVVHEAARVLGRGGHLCVAMGHPIQGVGDFSGEDRTGAYTLSRPYFEPQRLTYWAERAGRRVPLSFTHRPLSAYTNALEAAGFLIESLREPRPGDELAGSLLDLTQRQAVPSLIHLRARRDEPGGSAHLGGPHDEGWRG